MDKENEMEKRRGKEEEKEPRMDPEEFEREQQRQRQEVGEELIARVKKLICEKYPGMEGVEPLIRDESLEKMAGNIIERLKQLKTSDGEVDEMQKAWKSLLFRKEITREEMKLLKRVIAVINRRGDLLRIDETTG